MPKLFEYLGIVIMFYSNEHEPIHVHGKHGGSESKAELIIEDGTVVEVRIKGEQTVLKSQNQNGNK